MDGTMMDFPLTLTPMLERAGKLFSDGEIVTRLPDKSLHRHTYAELHTMIGGAAKPPRG